MKFSTVALEANLGKLDGRTTTRQWLYKTGLRSSNGRRRENRRRLRLLLGAKRQTSNIDLLHDLNGIIDLDAEIANSAFNLGMAEQ